MKKYPSLKLTLLRCLAALFLLSSLLAAGSAPQNVRAAGAQVAYIYGTDPTATSLDFFVTLAGRQVTVDTYSDAEAAALTVAQLAAYQTIIIGDDPDLPAGFLSANNIQSTGRPVVAIGNWGSQFLNLTGRLMISGGTGFLTNGADDHAHVADPTEPIWATPSPVSQINQTVALFNNVPATPLYALGNPAPVQFVNRIGRLPGDPNHYSLIADSTGGAPCYAFWGYRGLARDMTPSGLNLFLNFVLGNPCAPGTYTVTSLLAPNPPVIDGDLSYGEWTLTLNPNRLEMDHGFMAVMNDRNRLYLVLDVLESSVNNGGVNQNEFWVTFDTDNNGQIIPGVDLNYALQAATHNMRYQHYINPAQWDGLSTTTKSSLGPGFDCYPPDQTKVLNINTQKFDCSAHQLWEIAIDLKEINAAPGDTLHMGLRTSTPNPEFADEMPNSFDVDFSNLITVHLASIPIPPHDAAANIAFVNPNIEITQVVQDTANSIPLVANKTTAGRVSVITTGVSTPQPVLYYLYGQHGGAVFTDLPGSPLLIQMNAPISVNRANVDDTANFALPASWTALGGVIFHAEAADYNNNSITSPDLPLTFQGKAVPVYWIIQENNAAPNANPDLPTMATIASYESYVKTVFPVPDVDFVVKPWTAIGALNGASLDTNVDKVAKYYNAIAAAYWNAIQNNLPPPYALPELIFGAANMGGGISNPTWDNNGAGHAAVGGNATSMEGVVAHEFNHDLDRSSNGTWGRHVDACKASGPDPNWPNGTIPDIDEYGFDTRQPWQNTNTNKTVVPKNVPDLMSYCQSGFLPTKWISPYRYRAWFNSPIFPASLLAAPIDSIYITGQVNINNTGSLDPALLAPGIAITPSAAGAYSVVLSGPGITTITHAFNFSFVDTEGNPLTSVPFNFTLADPGGVSTIRLLHGAVELARIDKANTPPSASFTAPAAGTLTGTVAVSWTLTPGGAPAAGLRQELDFTTDDGDTWAPVAVNLPGTVTSYGLDTNLLPKTVQGRLRLVILDGLNNVTVVSGNTFTVENHPPVAAILAPLQDGFAIPGAPLPLQGQASDVDEASLPDGNFQWTLDGNVVLGLGENVQAVLPDGKHTLTLTAIDSDWATGSTSVTVYVGIYRVMLPLMRK